MQVPYLNDIFLRGALRYHLDATSIRIDAVRDVLQRLKAETEEDTFDIEVTKDVSPEHKASISALFWLLPEDHLLQNGERGTLDEELLLQTNQLMRLFLCTSLFLFISSRGLL